MQLLNRTCVLVDLETTGMSTVHDRITEVGLLRCEPGAAPVSWEQLVNPGTGIPETISRLTGITPAMVADQPGFADIAGELGPLLADAVFVAHNARFDYGFLKAALRACGQDFRPTIVCTLKLARSLFPQWPRHNLNALCEQIGYPRGVSHRAMADVQAMYAFLCYAIAHCGRERVDAAAAAQLKKPALPVHLAARDVDAIPDTPGVYYFYGENNALLYVGKSKTLRSRVLAHFSADHRNGREMALSQAVRRIDYTTTVGELGALLLENRQIKALAPIYNRRQRHYRSLWIWQLVVTADGSLQAQLSNQPTRGWVVAGDVYGPWRNRSTARKALQALVRDHQLCQRVLGLEAGSGPCFARQLGNCHGACEGRESVAAHNLRVIEAFSASRIKAWPFAGPIALREEGADNTCCYHLVNQWAYLGAASDFGQLGRLLEEVDEAQFDIETYRLLLRHIDSGRYGIVQAPDTTRPARFPAVTAS